MHASYMAMQDYVARHVTKHVYRHACIMDITLLVYMEFHAWNMLSHAWNMHGHAFLHCRDFTTTMDYHASIMHVHTCLPKVKSPVIILLHPCMRHAW